MSGNIFFQVARLWVGSLCFRCRVGSDYTFFFRAQWPEPRGHTLTAASWGGVVRTKVVRVGSENAATVNYMLCGASCVPWASGDYGGSCPPDVRKASYRIGSASIRPDGTLLTIGESQRFLSLAKTMQF